jgi:DNA invertase Pin-like site-specific DNA recombinase
MMGAIHQMERELRAERAASVQVCAKARGKTGGRPRTDVVKLRDAKVLYDNSGKTIIVSESKSPCPSMSRASETYKSLACGDRDRTVCWNGDLIEAVDPPTDDCSCKSQRDFSQV